MAESNPRARAVFRRARELRLKNRWSQERLAERMADCGHPMTRVGIANMEVGKYGSISIDRVSALAETFGVSLDYLISGPNCNACDDQPPAGFRCLACGAESNQSNDNSEES